LIYEDLLLFQLALQLKRREIKSLRAPKLLRAEEHIQEFLRSLPFGLTQAQLRVLREILEDVKQETPMNRLLQEMWEVEKRWLRWLSPTPLPRRVISPP
jgi:ATP-dependent DNA helicase RecG